MRSDGRADDELRPLSFDSIGTMDILAAAKTLMIKPIKKR